MTMDPCTLCGGEIGPDITGRPMCYGCGPVDMIPVKPDRVWHIKARRTVNEAGGLEFLDRRINGACERMSTELARFMFPVYEGPAEKPPVWHQRARRRLVGWWYSVREWIAVHVLRVEVVGEEDW